MKKILTLIVLLSISQIFAQKNLIKNGSFEQDAISWNGETALTISPYDKKIGLKGGNIYEYTSSQWKGIDQEFNIPKNTSALEFSAWVKTDAVEKGKNNWNKAVFVLEMNGKYQNLVELDGSTKWQWIKKIIPIDNARSAKLMIALSECTGSFFFDDIKISPISKEDYNKIIDEETKKRENISLQNKQNSDLEIFSNGNFENGKSAWRGNFNLTNTIKKEGNNAVILTSETKDWVGIDQQISVPENTKSVTISGWLKAENIKQGDNNWNNGLIGVEFTSDGKTKTAQDESVNFITGTTDWMYYTKTFNLPQNTKKIRVMVALGFATGTLYADDIKIKFNP